MRCSIGFCDAGCCGTIHMDVQFKSSSDFVEPVTIDEDSPQSAVIRAMFSNMGAAMGGTAGDGHNNEGRLTQAFLDTCDADTRGLLKQIEDLPGVISIFTGKYSIGFHKAEVFTWQEILTPALELLKAQYSPHSNLVWVNNSEWKLGDPEPDFGYGPAAPVAPAMPYDDEEH